MGVQLNSEWKSDNGTTYKVEVYNESFVGTLETVVTSDFSIDYESQLDPLMTNLKASRGIWEFQNQTTAVDTFLTNLSAGAEDQFKMVVYMDAVRYWVGVVIVDQMSYDDMSKPRSLRLTAIDGIGRLADIDFDFATDGTKAAQNSLLKYIYECLEYNDLSQYWSASDIYFRDLRYPNDHNRDFVFSIPFDSM